MGSAFLEFSCVGRCLYFISTLAISIFLHFVSVFTINVTRHSPELGTNSKNGVLHLGLQLSLIDESRQTTNESGVIFESKDLPLSKSAILLLLIVWQLVFVNTYLIEIFKDY